MISRLYAPWLRRWTPIAMAAALALAGTRTAADSGQDHLVVGPNTNVAGGPQVLTVQPFRVRGDVLGKAQNEPSCGLSSRNPQHVLCGANDYRMVDVPGVSITSEVRDAWLGQFQSTDGGATWESTLHPGFFLDPAPHVLKAQGFRAAADATVRTGPAGLAFYSGIAFSGPGRDEGAVFVSTFIDLNNRESDRMPFKFVRTILVDRGDAAHFIDKPWSFVEGNGGTCTLQVPLEDGTTVPQTVPASTIHMMYSVFLGPDPDQQDGDHGDKDHKGEHDHAAARKRDDDRLRPARSASVAHGDDEDDDDTTGGTGPRTQVMYTRSTDCGAHFSKPVKVSKNMRIGNGASIAKPMVNGSRRVYGAWRRFRTPDGTQGDAIVSVVSNDNGRSWRKPGVVAEICPFDQVTKATQFRATAFTTMTADAAGRAYVLWADRGRDPATGACNPLGKARLMMSTSTEGGAWTAPHQAVPSATDEHQIWPSIAFTAGKLVLAWVDFKEDKSGMFGRFVNEADVVLNAPPIRHTGDVRAAMASPGPSPDFLSDVTKVSRYLKGVGHVNGVPVVGQIQWNAYNKRWAKKGAVPFDGDYIDIGTVSHLPPDPHAGRPDWTPNNGQVPLTPTVLIAWTDNRDMRRVPGPESLGAADPPPVPYVTPLGLSLPGTSIFDPSQPRLLCTPGLDNYATGTFNQNVYAAPATREFVASSPANNKTLGTIQRAFVVGVRNDTDGLKQFQEVVSPPVGGFAAFHQFDTTKTSIVVTVPRHSSVARTVFVTPNLASPTPLDPSAVVPVSVTELSGGTPGQATTIFLNSDKSAPEIDGPEIDGTEVYTPEIDGQDIDAHGTLAPEIDGPEIDGPEIDGGEILSLGVQTPEIDGPEIDGPEIDGPEIDGPEIDGSALDAGAVTDFTYPVSSKGNTTAQVKAKAFVQDGPPGANYQVIVRRRYPVASVNDACMATTVNVSKVSVSILNTDVSSPEIDGASLDTASFFIAPDETVDFVIRVRTAKAPSPTELAALAQAVEIAVQQEAVNTADLRQGITRPPVFTSFLSIADSALPVGVVGVSYTRTLQKSGGQGALSWTLLAGGTGLPPGLTFAAGVISGTPTAAGTFTFTIQVQDSATPIQVATKTFTIVVTQAGTASLAFVTQPSDTGHGHTISPAPSVRAVSATAAPVAGVPVTIRLGNNPGGGTLTGTLTATTGVTGVAVFPSLAINNAGVGYTLVASAAGYVPATSVPFAVGAPADLVVLSLTHSPTPPTTASMITFTTIVRNAGTGPAGPSTLLFTVGAEPAGAPGTLFGVPSLAAGKTYTVERQMTLAAGSYVNTATADFTGAVAESDETNNTKTDAYTVEPPGPTPLTYTVGNTNDSGPGSLRQALLDANAHAATDTIVFDIPGPAPHVITLLSPLPGIDDAVLIDATPAGACAAGVAPTVEIDGVNTFEHGLFVTAAGTTIRGLAITRFRSVESAGIFIASGVGSVVECSYLGLAPDGVTVKGNYDGIRLGGSFTNTIGGESAAVRNVISGNIRNGVLIMGPLSVSGSVGLHQVKGNFIGTDATGTLDRGNGGQGVHIIRSASNTVGGTAAARNVISGNGGEGVRIDGAIAKDNVVQANYIGTSASGSADLGNSASGVYIRRAPQNSVIGNVVSGNDGFAGIAICGNLEFCGGGDVDPVPGVPESNASGNVVQANIVGRTADGATPLGNTGRGVSIDGAPNTTVGGPSAADRNIVSANSVGVVVFNPPASGNLIQRNSIYDNTGLGVDLGADGVTANDAGDADTGANDLQNFPLLDSALIGLGTTTVSGSLDSTADTTFVIDLYESASCDPSGNGEGQTWFGSVTATTDASGHVSFSGTFGVMLPVGSAVTALATSPGNSTSEFSACVTATVP